MKAARLHDYGGTEHFRIDEVDPPTPTTEEVLIDVEYAGLRWGDIMQRNGWPMKFNEPPFIAGQEAAGIISELGPGVSGLSVGDRVVALPTSGAFAEKLAI